jgi:pimeloyl-ACP methyl ester carboxylesterase
MGYSALLAQVRAELPANEPYVLLGESFSGPIAVELAAQASPQCVGLVLCCTFLRNPRPALSVFRLLLNAMPLWMPPLGVLRWLLLGKFSTPTLQQALAQAVRLVTPEVMRARLMSVLGVDVTTHMAAVTVPSLYLRAKHDRLVPLSASQRVSEVCPLTNVVEIDAPHCLLQTAPLDAANAVSAFIRSI